MPSDTSVIFARGDYACKTKYGAATVTIPRDITLGELKHNLARMFKGREKCTNKK